MPPPWATNPAPKTESAREALKTFFCDLCQKGYSRVNEFEAHEGSYDHQHKKRLKEMRALSRDPTAASRAREREEKDSGLVASTKGLGTLAPTSSSSSSTAPAGFKKGGFKKTGGFTKIAGPEPSTSAEMATEGPGDDAMDVDAPKRIDIGDGGDGDNEDGVAGKGGDNDDEDDWDTWGDYDPRKPTGCAEVGCTWNGIG